MNSLGRYLSMTAVRRRALHRALVWVPLLVVVLRIFSFSAAKALVDRLAAASEKASSSKRRPADSGQAVQAAAWAVQAVGRRVASTCLARALAGRLLLASIGEPSVVRLGVRPLRRGELAAHAWLTWRGHVLVGELRDIGEFRALPSL